MAENHSYQGRKFDAGRLVVPTSGTQRVGVVHPKSKFERDAPDHAWVHGYPAGYGMHYWVKYAGRLTLHEYWGEDSLREVTVWEFLWHDNPETGGRQIGNNPLWAFVLCCLAVPATWYFLRGEPDPYSWTLRIVLTAAPFLWLWFTYRQHIGKSR